MAGITLGTIVLFRDLKDADLRSSLVQHEMEHVRQCKILGPFVLVLYPLASFLSWLLYNKLYRGNWYEIMARVKAQEQKPQ